MEDQGVQSEEFFSSPDRHEIIAIGALFSAF